MEVGVREKASAVEIGVPRQLFQMPLRVIGVFERPYTVAPNGQRFLVNALAQGNAPEPLTLVTNWTASLEKK